MLAVVPLALAVALAAGPAGTADAWQEAERLARSGHTREALQRFQQIVQVHPEDVEARLWVARLLRWSGENDLAEEQFERALAQAPDHADALTGLAMVLNARGAFDDASALLDRAEHLSPENPDVLAARAHGLRRSGRFMEAEGYYARAQVLSPGDPDIRQGLEQVRRLNRHRVEAHFSAETLTASPAGAGMADITLDLRASERMRVSASVQAQSRFSRNEARAGGGVEWRARPGLTVRGSTLIGPGADVIARSDTSGEVERVQGPVELVVGVRAMTFAAADVWVVAPAATWWLNDRAAVTLRYYGSRTAFDDRPAAPNHSGALRVRLNVHPRIWLDAGYARGFESFEELSADRLGRFRADTVSGGVLCHLPGLQSLAASVVYQRRDDDRTMIRVAAGVAHRF